jgi:hypothetical protein
MVYSGDIEKSGAENAEIREREGNLARSDSTNGSSVHTLTPRLEFKL